MTQPAAGLTDRRAREPASAEPAPAVRSRAYFVGTTLLAVVATAVLSAARAWPVVWRGRVYAEDGIFLALAREHSLGQMLLWVQPHTGYIAFNLNVIAVAAARLVPLEYVGLFFSACWILTMLLPLAVVLTEPALRRLGPLVAVQAALLFTFPHPEGWLAIACTQFALAIAVAVVLALPARADGWRWFRRGLLVFAGLSGAAPAILAVPFVLRAAWDRSRERWVQAALIAACLALQVYTYRSYGTRQLTQPSPTEVGAALVVQQFQLPFTGYHFSAGPIPDPVGTRGEALYRATVLDTLTFPATAFLLVVPALIWGGGLLFVVRARSAAGFYLWFAALLIAAAALRGTRPVYLLATYGAGRFFFAVNTLLALSLIACLADARLPRTWKAAGWAVLAWVWLFGAIEFTRPQPLFFEGPTWSDQIAAWRQDPTRELALDPAVGVRIHLKP